MNKKGFTLVELLAVIVILGVVMTIGITSISTVRRNINLQAFQSNIENILMVAKTWGNDNKELLTNTLNIRGENKKGITKKIDELIASGDLHTDERKDYSPCTTRDNNGCKVVTNSYTGVVINDLKINIYLDHQRVYACIVNDLSAMNTFLKDSDINEYGTQNNYCINF